jgi:hypothetical protein
MGDKAVDEMVARLRSDLFLDLFTGEELDLLVDGQVLVNEVGQPARFRLEWWARIDDQSAKLKLKGAVQAGPNQDKWLIVDTTGNIINKLESQGIFFRAKIPTSFTVVEDSGPQRLPAAQAGLKAKRRTRKTSKRPHRDQITTSAHTRRNKPIQRSTGRNNRKSAQRKKPFQRRTIIETSDEDKKPIRW